MTLLAYEWRKLARLPALWLFLALCLAFNGLLLFETNGPRQRFNEASAITKELGQRVDGDFLEGLENRSRTKYEYITLAEAREMTDIFADYDTQYLSGFYAHVLENSPTAQRIMVRKYSLLVGRVERLSETGAAMDLYAGPVTQQAHKFLYGSLFPAIAMEAAILGMLSMLYLLSYEEQRRTVSLACSSRTGRRLYRQKVLAGLTAAVVLYALLAAATLAVYFALWDYSGIWSASVSSQFNYLVDMMLRRPFLTWADFTVATYLAAVLTLGAALTAVFSLLATVCGLLLRRNAYAPALVLAVLGFGGVGQSSVLAEAGLWPAYFLALLHPSCVWLAIGGWFTELGLAGAVPWQETTAVGLNLLVLSLGTLLALRHFGRKDIVT